MHFWSWVSISLFKEVLKEGNLIDTISHLHLLKWPLPQNTQVRTVLLQAPSLSICCWEYGELRGAGWAGCRVFSILTDEIWPDPCSSLVLCSRIWSTCLYLPLNSLHHFCFSGDIWYRISQAHSVGCENTILELLLEHLLALRQQTFSRLFS